MSNCTATIAWLPHSLTSLPLRYLLMRLRKKNYHLSLLHVSSICCRSQNWYQSLCTDDSFTGCHVAIWSSFACAKGFRLHFHNTQLYSGECPIETLNLNQSRLFNLHSSNQREKPLQWLDDLKKKFKNLLTIHLTRNIFVAVLLDLLDIDFWRRLLYALCTEIPKQRTLRRFLLRWNIVKKWSSNCFCNRVSWFSFYTAYETVR